MIVSHRYISAMNGMIGSDVGPANYPKILALILAEPTVPPQDKQLMQDEAHRFTDSPPMDLMAVYDELAATVTLTLGRRSYEMSQKVLWIGFKVVPNSDYLKYEFEIRNEAHGATRLTGSTTFVSI